MKRAGFDVEKNLFLFSWKKKNDFVHRSEVSLLFLNEPRAERRRLGSLIRDVVSLEALLLIGKLFVLFLPLCI